MSKPREEKVGYFVDQDGKYNYVEPDHYQSFTIEVIDMMEAIWGRAATANYCELCAFKYKMRAGDKPKESMKNDMLKAKWYLNKMKELRK